MYVKIVCKICYSKNVDVRKLCIYNYDTKTSAEIYSIRFHSLSFVFVCVQKRLRFSSLLKTPSISKFFTYNYSRDECSFFFVCFSLMVEGRKGSRLSRLTSRSTNTDCISLVKVPNSSNQDLDIINFSSSLGSRS